MLIVDAWLQERAPAAFVADTLRYAWRPPVVSRDEWLAARRALLDDEKALTRARDAVSTRRRLLPMVELDKEYVFVDLTPLGRQEPWEEPKDRSTGLGTGARDTLRYHDEYDD